MAKIARGEGKPPNVDVGSRKLKASPESHCHYWRHEMLHLQNFPSGPVLTGVAQVIDPHPVPNSRSIMRYIE